jgi:Protein of unknown function (DUF1761)
MFGLDINILAVLVAAAVGFAIGGIWYSGKVFGPVWMKTVAKPREQMGSPGKAMVIAGITQIVTALVMATIFSYVGVPGAGLGAIIGLEFGLGLIVPFACKGASFEGRSWTLVAINSGEHVVSLTAMGAILGAWQ